MHFWNGCSEYIIDLMGAPGALIPAEAPSGRLQNLGLDITTVAAIGIGSFSAADQGARAESSSTYVDETAKTGSSSLDSSQVAIASDRNGGRLAGKIQCDLLEHATGDIYLPSTGTCEMSLVASKKTNLVELQVEDVPRYILLLLANQFFLRLCWYYSHQDNTFNGHRYGNCCKEIEYCGEGEVDRV